MVPSLALALWLAAPFPLPSVDGKPLAVTEAQKTFRYPLRFEKIRAFYEERFGKGQVPTVKWQVSGVPGERVLTLINTDKKDTWKKAIVREKDGETIIDVTPVLRLGEEEIVGNGRPLVEFVFGRSPDVDRAVQGIDHTEDLRR
ncbi:MAG: hypothetical protein AB1938_10275 [Myxococcota bacterium]